VQAGFEPLVQGFARAPFNDIESIKNIAKSNSNIVAILVEPIQGESGIKIPDADYLNQLRDICDDNDWLLMLDEIQTGMGRTGKWFAHQHNGIQPDVMTLAKSLGNGVPIGACIANEKAASVMQPGSHGSTFGGNPLACAAALAVVDTIEKDQLLSKATKQGNALLESLKNKLGSCEGIREIRGKGMMIGIELVENCSELLAQALQQGLLISIQAENVIRLLPPLTLSKEEADTIVTKVSTLITTWLQKKAA
jgi:acetylornithine aminotransferase